MTDLRIQDGEGLVGAQHPTLNDSINRLTLEEHSMAGKHKVVSLEEQASTPAAVADFGKLYTKDVSGVTELFYRDSAGNETQLTDGGGDMGGLENRAYTVTVDSDSTQSPETTNITIDEVADINNFAIIVANGGGQAVVATAGGTVAAQTLKAELTTPTNMLVTWLDSANTVTDTIVITVQAEMA